MRKFIAMLLLTALPAAPAFAAKPDKDGGKGKGHGNGNASRSGKSEAKHGGGQSWSNAHDDRDHSPRFTNGDLVSWRDYWHEQYEHGHCPPGLAKKNNGCLPPGQAKKRYRVGHPVPPDVVIVAVPPVLLPRLSPLPPGYRYGMIDGDLVKLAVGSLLVVDAIQGLTR